MEKKDYDKKIGLPSEFENYDFSKDREIAKKEQQLREAAEADALTHYSGTIQSEYVMSVSENTFMRAVKSDAAKQYYAYDFSKSCKCDYTTGETWCCNQCGLPTGKHSPVESVEGLREERDILFDALPTGNIEAWQLLEIIQKHIKRLDKIIDSSHIQKQQESDAVQFAEWVALNNYEKHNYGWSKTQKGFLKTADVKPTLSSQELYQLFKSNNNGNT